jgi:hypothetical protein
MSPGTKGCAGIIMVPRLADVTEFFAPSMVVYGFIKV